MIVEHIPALRNERQEGMVLVSQRREGQTATVALHAVHIRFLVEQFGLAPTSDPAAVKLNAVLSRCLRVLRERIDVLDSGLTDSPNLIDAFKQTPALSELAEGFIEDLPAVQAQGP